MGKAEENTAVFTVAVVMAQAGWHLQPGPSGEVSLLLVTTRLRNGVGSWFEAVVFRACRAWPEIGQDTCVA